MLHSDCASHIPAFRIRGRLCKTNQASNTAFRGFGGPQGMLIANMWMDHGAHALGLAPVDVYEKNMYKAGAVTHFGQAIEGERLEACWQDVMRTSEWRERRAAVDTFNTASRCADRLHRLRLRCNAVQLG
jgi:xanthine dehydrogenase/oxidase